MSRLTDNDPVPKRLPPVYGYLSHPLLSLREAIDPILPQIEQLDRYVKIARQACHFPSEHNLTLEESAAVYLYTMEWGDTSFYQMINRALRLENRDSVKPWFGYLKLFDTAIQKLPTFQGSVWRGAAVTVDTEFHKDDEFIWWNITSCSASVGAIKGFVKPNSTLFLIEARNAKDVSKYTQYTTENEVIFCPGTKFRVMSDALEQTNLHIVHLKEITDDDMNDELSSAPESVSTDESKFKPSLLRKTATDENGNRYELGVQILHKINSIFMI